MLVLKQTLTTLAVLLATLQITHAAPTKLRKRALNSSAPLSSDIDGVHILLNNDVDSETSKNAFLLLSKPRNYYDGMSACDTMGDGKIRTATRPPQHSFRLLMVVLLPFREHTCRNAHVYMYN